MNDVVCKQAGKAYISCSRHAPVLGRKQLSWTPIFWRKIIPLLPKEKAFRAPVLGGQHFLQCPGSLLALSCWSPAGLLPVSWFTAFPWEVTGVSWSSLGGLLALRRSLDGFLLVTCGFLVSTRGGLLRISWCCLHGVLVVSWWSAGVLLATQIATSY